MSLENHILIFIILSLIILLSQINGAQSKNITTQRKLQNTASNYVILSFDKGFQTDTCLYSRISDKISKVSVNYEDVIEFPSSFTIPEGGTVQIYFNTNLKDLSYFLSYNEDLEEEEIPLECLIDDHFKSHITIIDLSNLEFSEITSTAKMFKGYISLTNVLFSGMKNPNITTMNGMFSDCSSLTIIDLTNLITDFVNDMGYMFSGCSSLRSIQVPNFDASKITNLEYMFRGCSSLTSFILPQFLSSVENMEGIFYSCTSLENVSGSFLNTESLKNINNMFYNCFSLNSIELSNFDTLHVQYMNFVFYNCTSLISLDLSEWETTNVISMDYIFSDCTSLIVLLIPNFFMQQLMDSINIFKNVNKLRYIDIKNMKYNSNEDYNDNTCINHDCNVTLNYNDNTIYICQNNQFITNSKIKNICCIFDIEDNICRTGNYIKIYFNQNSYYKNGFKNEFRNECSFVNYNNSSLLITDELNILEGTKLEIYFNNLATSLEKFFSTEIDNNMINIISIDFSDFIFFSVENMKSMFYGCNSLKYIDFGYFYTLSLINVAKMFYGCISLKEVDLSTFFMEFVENMNSMFYECTSLENIKLPNFNEPEVIDVAKMFEGCESLVSIDLSNFNSSKVVYMDSMFANCIKLEVLNLSVFDTSMVKTMDYMFYNCISLSILDISNFNMLQITSNAQMFTGIKNLKYINLYNIQDNGNISLSELNINNTIENVFFVCQKIELITHYKALNCCEFYDNKEHCGYNIDTNINLKVINITAQIETIYNNIIENMEDRNNQIIKTENIVLQYSTIDEQLNNKSKMISSVDLGECENYLRQQEGLNETEEFLIIKLDIINKNINATYVQYEIFNPRNYSKVSLDICKNISIKITVPVILDESSLSLIESLENSGYNIFDINDSFYNDICSTYTAENGANIALSSRKNKIYDSVKNIYLCQEGCEFVDFDTEISNAVCNCKVQENPTVIDISKISFNKTKFFDSFYNTLYYSNFRVIKCFKLLFSLEGMKSNYGSYIMTVLLGIFITFIIIHLIKGVTKIINIINNIIKSKEINENNNNIEDNKFKSDKKKETKNNTNTMNSKIDKNIKIEILSPPIKRISIKKGTKKRNKNKINLKQLTLSTEDEVNKENLKIKEIIIMEEKNMEDENQIVRMNEDLTEVEINDLDYEKALIIDKRTFCQIYFSLLKRGHLILFTFIINDDYNLYQIKILLFIVSFSLFFTINASFFSDNIMDKIYDDNNVFNFVFQLPQIIYSSLISNIIEIILKKLSISEEQILDMKKEKDIEKSRKKANNIKNRLKIKLIIFLVISSLFMLFFWYFISCFCSVYKNTQVILIENTLISFVVSMIYPFGFKLIPVILRVSSLRAPKKDQKYNYKISLFLDIF